MPLIPIIMPQLGESIAEATVVSIAVKVGDHIEADQDVMEVETNKAVMAVASPCPGVVKELLVDVQRSYNVGAVLGYLEVTIEDAKRLGLDEPVPSSPMENGAAEAATNLRLHRAHPAERRPAHRRRTSRPRLRHRRELHVAAHESPHARAWPPRS